MTPRLTQQQLHAEIKRTRYSHTPRTYLWTVAVQADVSVSELYRLASGTASARTVKQAEAWLARHTAPSPNLSQRD